MPIEKIAEVSESGNDAYVVSSMGRFILINENYHAVKLLDSGLGQVAKLPIPDGTSVYHVYPEPDGKSAALYCPDSGNILLMVAITDQIVRVVNIPDASIAGPLHYWDGKKLVIRLESGRFLFVNDDGASLLPDEDVKTRWPQFSAFVDMASKRKVWEATGSMQLLYEEAGQLFYYDHRAGTCASFPKLAVNAHHLATDGNSVLYVSETGVFVQSHSGDVDFIPSAEDFYYLRAAFLGRSSPGVFVVLSSSRGNSRASILQSFRAVR